MGSKKGVVLIVVLGVLIVLALLGTMFATLSATERKVARNYMDGVRAKLLATSGVEDALPRLRSLFPARAFDKGPAHSSWVYYGAEPDRYGTKNPIWVPLESAVDPSFPYTQGAVQDPNQPNPPLTLVIEGKPHGLSGVMDSGTYGIFGDHYALSVSDLSGRLYLNDGLDGGPNSGVSQNLKRMLNALGAITPAVNAPSLGDKILAARPKTGFRMVEDLLPVLGQTVFDRVKPFVTAHAWVDPNVANPVPLSKALVDYETSIGNSMPGIYAQTRGGLYRFGKSKDALGTVLAYDLNTCPPVMPTADPATMAPACLYGVDTLNPQWIEIVSRAPVNVNAAPREVLVALLTDLKGFYVGDRRRNNPSYVNSTFPAFTKQMSFSPAGTEGDEYGFLYQTLPITGPGSTSTGISAFAIADEIIACRAGKASANFDYGSVCWGGPFRSWNQFNAFVDNLVTIGVLQDTRPIFYDYPADGSSDAQGYGTLVPSAIQRAFASQAIADAIKANFNPNLHLNILNPDENLFLIVDKTELIVNSTEFVFLPTGYFEIESLGRVVRPMSGYDDCRNSPDNQLVAQAKVKAVYKLYDMYRETDQKQFQKGTLSSRQSHPETINNMSIMVGPEPDNGTAPAENEWDGYIALPTVGGMYHGTDAGLVKPSGALWTTLGNTANTPQFNDCLHAHFGLDFDAHYHILGTDARPEIASRTLPDESVENFPATLPDGTTVAYPGPYAPTSGAGNVHRQARSFRVSPGGTPPSLAPFAPSGLRSDGGYSERHSAPAYYVQKAGKGIWNFSSEPSCGMVSFWYKPSYSPERTGKVRSMWDLSRWHSPCFRGCHVWPFALWFFPSHSDPAIAEANVPPMNDFAYYYDNASESLGRFYPASLVYGSGAWHNQPVNPTTGFDDFWVFGKISTSLNHFGHPDQAIKSSPLRAHRWVQLTFDWNLFNRTGSEFGKLYINNWVPPYSYWNVNYWPDEAKHMWYFERHNSPTDGAGMPSTVAVPSTGDYNHMRLGAPSKIANCIPDTPYKGNHTADGTFAEFFVWQTDTAAAPDLLWRRGRYYKPTKPGEAVFTSKNITFLSTAARILPPPSTTATPPSAGGSGSGPSSTLSLPAPGVRVLGVSFTWYGEKFDSSITPPASQDPNKPVLYDHNSSLGDPIADVKPRVGVSIKDGSVLFGPYYNDGASAVLTPDGQPLTVQNPGDFHYTVRIELQQTNLDTILLATPVVDDVTIYWDNGGPVAVAFYFDGRSF